MKQGGFNAGDGQASLTDNRSTTFKEFFKQTEVFLENMEPMEEEKVQLLESVFGVQFDSFEIRKQKEKKFYPECDNKLSGFCGTVTYQGIKYLLLDGVIIMGDDSKNVGWIVLFQGNGKCGGYENIISFDDAIKKYKRESGKLGSLDNSTETEFLYEQGLGCYKHHESGLTFRTLYYRAPNEYSKKYIMTDAIYKKRKNNGCNVEILKFMSNILISDLVNIRKYQTQLQ